MIKKIQIGDREFTTGSIEYDIDNHLWKLKNRPTKYLSSSILEEWESYSEYIIKNPVLSGGHTGTFFTYYNNDSYQHSDIYAFPGFTEGDKQVYIVWYKIWGKEFPVNFPNDSRLVGFSIVTENEQHEKILGTPRRLNWDFTWQQGVNSQEQGIGFYIATNTDNEYIYSPYSFGVSNFTSTGPQQLYTCRYTDVEINGNTFAGGPEEPANLRSYMYDSNINLTTITAPVGVELKIDDEPTSGTGGSDGTFDPFGDDVDYPSLPSVSAVDTGLLTIYKPTLAELRTISAWLWSMDDTIFDKLKKIYSNVMDYIVSLQFLPIAANNTSTTNVTFGNTDTEILSTKVNSQYIATDEVTISIDEYYGSFIDYAPTKIMLYLPFIGFRELTSQDVMSGTIGVKYHIDLLTGDCVAFVKVYSRTTKSVLYTYNGNCSSQAPLSGRDFSQIFSASVNAVASIGAVATGSPSGLLSAGTALVDLMQAQNSVNRGGAISGNAGFLTEYQPYLIFARPSASYPDNYNHYYGKPANITRKLSSLTGFTSIKETITDGFGNATDEEVNEINRLLKEGIYL